MISPHVQDKEIAQSQIPQLTTLGIQLSVVNVHRTPKHYFPPSGDILARFEKSKSSPIPGYSNIHTVERQNYSTAKLLI
jgi:hypothetical protein